MGRRKRAYCLFVNPAEAGASADGMSIQRGREAEPSPFCVSKSLSLPLSEGELKGVPAQQDAGGAYPIHA